MTFSRHRLTDRCGNVQQPAHPRDAADAGAVVRANGVAVARDACNEVADGKDW